MPNIMVNHSNNTIIIDGLLKNNGFKVIVFPQEPKDIQAFSMTLRFKPERMIRMLPCHWLWRLEAKARSIGVGKLKLSPLLAAFQFCQMLLASLVLLRVGSFSRTLDNPFEAIPGFLETTANRLGA